jgi:hypothetical protein
MVLSGQRLNGIKKYSAVFYYQFINLGSLIPGGIKRLNPSEKCGVRVIYFFVRMNQKSAPLTGETLYIFICCACFLNINGLRYRRLEGRDSPTKRRKPKATKKVNLAVRIQPSACTPSYAIYCLTPLIFKFSEKQFTCPPN